MPHTELDSRGRIRCRHIYTGGSQCGSPALLKEQFCYYHHTNRRPPPPPGKFRHIDAYEPFTLPLVEDRASALAVAAHLLSRIASNDLDPTRAGAMLFNLQIITTLLPREAAPKAAPESAPAPPLVEELVLDPALGPVAPITLIAELPAPEQEQAPSIQQQHELPAETSKEDAVIPSEVEEPPHLVSSKTAVRPTTSNLEPGTSNLLPYILVPDLRVLTDEPAQQPLALGRVEVDHLNAVLFQPVHAAAEGLALPHHQAREPELPHQP